MYAVIRSGGKQYRVGAGDVIEVDRLPVGAGETVTFTPVLVVDGPTVKARPAELDTALVKGEVVTHLRGPKIRVFNYKAKGGWKKTKGHRQELTAVKITEIA